MKGDFSRVTFDPNNNFLRVLMQQGRVQLDADWNEQISILLHYMQTLAVDLIGPHAGAGEESFKISRGNNEFSIGKGHYYVNGLLCVNDESRPLAVPDDNESHLVYLDVWEAHLTSIQDESIREVALGGPDTTTRSKVVWEAKVWAEEWPTDVELNCEKLNETWPETVRKLWKTNDRGKLIATLAQQPVSTDPCAISPQSRYRGLENQLYRVEIHKGGSSGEATFKWSRDNGSVVFPIDTLAGNIVTLKEMGHDDRFTLKKGNWVEIIDDDYALTTDKPIFKVESVDPPAQQVRLDLRGQTAPTIEANSGKHPFLRRWDHQASYGADGKPDADGAIKIIEDDKLDLENNIQIEFKNGSDTEYQAGDYWLIPARTATGDIEWPKNSKGEPPRGIDHYYAPLAIIKQGEDPTDDCRRIIKQLTRKPGESE